MTSRSSTSSRSGHRGPSFDIFRPSREDQLEVSTFSGRDDARGGECTDITDTCTANDVAETISLGFSVKCLQQHTISGPVTAFSGLNSLSSSDHDDDE